MHDQPLNQPNLPEGASRLGNAMAGTNEAAACKTRDENLSMQLHACQPALHGARSAGHKAPTTPDDEVEIIPNAAAAGSKRQTEGTVVITDMLVTTYVTPYQDGKVFPVVSSGRQSIFATKNSCRRLMACIGN